MKKSAWIILTLLLSSCATVDSNDGMSALDDWQFLGKGFTAQADGGVLLSEYPGSAGVMLINPDVRRCGTQLQFDVLPMNPESVLVVMMAASEPGPGKSLRLPASYDGSIGHLLNDTEAYFFAFHNAAHNRTPFVRKHPFDRATSADLATFPNNVLTTQWHEIEVVHSCDGSLRLAVDSNTIIEANDIELLQGGQIVLRLRGTKTHTAAALFRNVSISTVPVSQN